jgi:hypothetical protein
VTEKKQWSRVRHWAWGVGGATEIIYGYESSQAKPARPLVMVVSREGKAFGSGKIDTLKIEQGEKLNSIITYCLRAEYLI